MRHYFPGLNTIRLWAAICVILHHVISFSGAYPFTANIDHWISFFILSGNQAVSLFMVLSGFLITYILLTEKQQSGTIQVKNFYIRRALRIQPLYILIIVLTLLIPAVSKPDAAGLLSLVLISPHLTILLGGWLGAARHLWSIGVEEWFYLALPPLLKRINVVVLAWLVILIMFVLALLYPDALAGVEPGSPTVEFLKSIRFESMAIGALGAWLYSTNHWLLRWVYALEIPALLLMLFVVVIDIPQMFLFNFLFSWVCIVFILNVATNPKRHLSLEHPTLSKLGAVTYGVYMYHSIVTYVLSAALMRFGIQGTWADVSLYIGAVVITIGVALVSYHMFEKRFLTQREAKPVLIQPNVQVSS